MNSLLATFILLLFVSPSWGAMHCSSLWQNEQLNPERRNISTAEYDGLTDQLRSTLSGRLATVWRSEWKAKSDTSTGQHFLMDLFKEFLTPNTRALVEAGPDTSGETNSTDDFFSRAVKRLSEAQSSGELKENDRLLVRDVLPPSGAVDSTFTYYTKAIVEPRSEAKHQIRVRTYLRDIIPSQMKVGSAIQALDTNRKVVTVTRLGPSSWDVDGTPFTQLDKLVLFAPHGKNYKLEIKSALKDQIQGDDFPLLRGPHMVQKLDVSLSEDQVQALFAPYKSLSRDDQIAEARQRIQSLLTNLLSAGADPNRINAVFDVLKAGLAIDPNFLHLEGATHYQRVAFESKSGFQATIDRNQEVFTGAIYGPNRNLLTPTTITQNQDKFLPQVQDQVHMELKFPVDKLATAVGVNFYNPSANTTPALSPAESDFQAVASIFHSYLRNDQHRGKFNYIKSTGSSEDVD